MIGNTTRRSARVAERVKAELMDFLIRGAVRDPGASGVWVSGVTVSADLKHARIFIRLTEVDAAQPARDAALKALTRASGYLRKELAPRLKLKYMPELSFYWDDHVDQASRVEELLLEIGREIKPPAE